MLLMISEELHTVQNLRYDKRVSRHDRLLCQKKFPNKRSLYRRFFGIFSKGNGFNAGGMLIVKGFFFLKIIYDKTKLFYFRLKSIIGGGGNLLEKFIT